MSPLEISGYVLAGGKSLRMGRDKALLELVGKPLIEHAVLKLQPICREVHILSSVPALETFAPLVTDLHSGCGPLGGIEAALVHSPRAWSLFLPVDMPFVDTSYLVQWAASVIASAEARVALFTIGGRPQPTLCLLHQDLTPYVQSAIARGEYKLNPVLAGAALSLAKARDLPLEQLLLNREAPVDEMFSNLNTPDEFALAAKRLA